MISEFIKYVVKKVKFKIESHFECYTAWHRQMAIDGYLKGHLYQKRISSEKMQLNFYEFQVFSQNGEDGIIDEIFKRVGTTNKFFAEIGIGDGSENNTRYLLFKGWSGAWFDACSYNVKIAKKSFKESIDNSRLSIHKVMLTRENISIFEDALIDCPEPDILSIDVDGNDYWLWKAMSRIQPRVIVIEYNGIYRPNDIYIQPYTPSYKWDYTANFGASLKALEELGRSKGYLLVGCDVVGINAFFVRQDVVKDLFLGPYDADTHYEPCRYFLSGRRSGHPRFILN